MNIPLDIGYLLAGLAGGVCAGWLVGWIFFGRRIAALTEKYISASNALSGANAGLSHLETVSGRLAEKEAEIRVLNDRLADARARRAELETRIENQRREADEKALLFEEMRGRMIETFSALSARALRENNQSFLDLAGSAFSRYADAAKTDLESRGRAVSDLVRPLRDSLEQFDNHVRALEQARQAAYGRLSEQVTGLARTQQDLAKETGKLVQALRLPHVRGRWGEITLRRVVEIAGMQNHCDFFEQPTVATEDGALRPDMVVRLPGGRQVVIDAKVPITAYLDSLEAETPEKSMECLARHAAQVQRHVGQLAQKSYWNRFAPTPEFVVLFMPGENFFSAALSQTPSLIEEAADKGVILATPTTLISLLKTVAYTWRQEAAVENARAVSELASSLYRRIYGMVEHVNKLGRDLDRCVESYNRAVGSLEKRVLVSARKFQEMGAAGHDQKQLDTPAPVENRARQIVLEVDEYESAN